MFVAQMEKSVSKACNSSINKYKNDSRALCCLPKHKSRWKTQILVTGPLFFRKIRWATYFALELPCCRCFCSYVYQGFWAAPWISVNYPPNVLWFNTLHIIPFLGDNCRFISVISSSRVRGKVTSITSPMKLSLC